MTGIDCLKSELMKMGFSESKIRMNIELIMAIVSVVSENKEQVNAARLYYEMADDKLDRAREYERDAKHQLAAARQAELNARSRDSDARASEREAMAAEQRAHEIEMRLETMETAEARDKIRLAHLFDKMTERKTCYDNTAYIKGLAAILQGTEIEKEVQNNDER